MRYKIKNLRPLMSFLFLIMIVGSVFSANIDPSRVISEKKEDPSGCTFMFSDISDLDYVYNRGDGCATIRLPEEAVRKIWNDIIVSGFKIDRVESNIDATLDREELIQNELLVTGQDAVAGDMAGKVEMPDKLMNPLETSALLAQSCEGSFQYGLDLDSTLRTGRCEDSASGCYTRSFGLFRQNGLTGFFPEMASVGKDLLDFIGVNKAREAAGEIITGDKTDYNIELGPFSDASVAEMNHYKNLLETTDTNEMNIEGLKLVTDKAISNVIETSSFSANMATTGSTENTFIHSYSLFDKMFNQYYSTDMVFSAGRVLLGATTAKLMRVPGIQSNYAKIVNKIKPTFLKNLMKDPARLILDTKRTVGSSFVAARKSRAGAKMVKNMSENGSAILGIQNQTMREQMIAQNNLNQKMKIYRDAVKKGKGEVSDKIINNPDFFKDMTSKQKSVFYSLVNQENMLASLAKENASEIMKLDHVNTIQNKIIAAKQQGKTTKEMFKSFSPEEFNAYNDAMLAYQDLLDGVNAQGVNLKKAMTAADFSTNKIKINPDHLDAAVPGHEVFPESVFSTSYQTKTGVSTQINDKMFKFNEGFNVATAKTKEVSYQLADGSFVKRNVIMPEVSVPSGTPQQFTKIADIETFIKNNPSGVVQAKIGTQTVSVTPQNFESLKSQITHGTGFPEFNTQSIETIIKPEHLDDYLLDPINVSDTYFNKMSNAITNDYAGAVDMTQTHLNNKGFIDYASTSFADFKMKQFVTQNNVFDFAGKSLEAFGYNFLFWQTKRGFADVGFLSPLGLDKFSVYRLPESYSAINITHGMSPPIYDDAYIDFFANDGSDQGDLFMKFLNSAIFIFPKIIKTGLEVTAEYTDFQLIATAERSIDNMLRGKIKRDLVDNIVLFTDTINTGCGTNCRINIGSDYIEQQTRERSLEGLSADMYNEYMQFPSESEQTITRQDIQERKTQDQLANLDSTVEIMKEQYLDAGYNQQEVQEIVDEYREAQLEAIKENEKRFEYEDTTNYVDPSAKLNINFYVPRGFNTSNYILENTTPENYENKGQNLVTFSHHTDYSGINEGEKSEEEINLVKARQEGDTCEQKIRELNLGGINVGWALPKDYRLAVALTIPERAAYWTLPHPANPLLAPALLMTLPKQIIVMPQIKGCVDDQEGLYTHFFMNSLEYERIEEDPTNKVADMVDQGLDGIEGTLKNITKGTEFEKTVSAGTQEAKGFVEKNLRDHAIVQSSFSTSAGTDASLDGRLFFFELGPDTRCRANNLNDQGKEILIDEDKKEGLEIDKEKGELNLIDKDGNINKIIDSDHSDFVRLVATNLGIPAKIIPKMLTYIPVSDNPEELLFEMDVYGNFFVQDNDFMHCIRQGYYEQTGNEIDGGATNLTEYLGAVKSANIINPSTQYDVYPQTTKISAQGTPRQVAEGTSARLSIYGDRTSRLFPIEEVESKRINLGKNISVQFERGQLVYSGEKNAYIMWVEYTSVTSGADIKDLDAELTSTPAQNECDDDEIAFDFKATSTSDDPNSQAYANVEKMNNALENVGPFQMFDTPTKTILFYISDYPECEQRMRIIDKKTGEVYDQKITDIFDLEDGYRIQTEDGASHDFDISAEHGVPKLKYNDDVETLTSAQGQQGGFWYDPKTGNWYTENGMMIPYNQAFRDGMLFSTDADGKVTGKTSGNVFNIGTDAAGRRTDGFNIPLSPTSTVGLMMYILFFVSCFYIINTVLLKNKKKR